MENEKIIESSVEIIGRDNVVGPSPKERKRKSNNLTYEIILENHDSEVIVEEDISNDDYPREPKEIKDSKRVKKSRKLNSNSKLGE